MPCYTFVYNFDVFLDENSRLTPPRCEWKVFLKNDARFFEGHKIIKTVFSTSDISYQMCYCCRKIDFQGNLKSASNVQLSDWLRERILYIWGRFSIHLRQILYTFEANLYIWGRDNLFSHVMPLSQSENRICTFQIRPQMYRESASNV